MKMQPFSYRDADDLGYSLQGEEKKIFTLLRHLILENLPGCREKLAYNVPFYYLNRRVCFIWPSAVPWGKSSPTGVQLGFCAGYLLDDQSGYLQLGNRKEVSLRNLHHVSEVDVVTITDLLFQAREIDAFYAVRKGKR